jgi:hypothetical protein
MAMIMEVKTIEDIIELIDSLPVEAFADIDAGHSINNLIQMRRREWEPAHDRFVRNDINRLERRQATDTARHAKREQWARVNIKKGMFIKVTGARDGHGIREVISVTTDGVVCRQWLPSRSPHNEMFTFVSRPGYVANFAPANQMTDHMFDKVAGYFTIDVNRRGTLHKIT